jgi:hypothetical protein
VPDVPVPDVAAVRAHCRDRLGFELAWDIETGRIGAVSHGDCAILFRESAEIRTATFRVCCEDVDDTRMGRVRRGAEVSGPTEATPRGLHQFTVRHPCGNMFHVCHDP